MNKLRWSLLIAGLSLPGFALAAPTPADTPSCCAPKDDGAGCPSCHGEEGCDGCEHCQDGCEACDGCDACEGGEHCDAHADRPHTAHGATDGETDGAH